MAKLYLIATPIGNRKDITIRALRRLFRVDVLLCEDTRNTKRLLDFFQSEYKDLIEKETFPILLSFYEHNEEQRIGEVVNFLRENKNVGLVSNAGTPSISDPGFRLINFCRENGIDIVGLPGPSAFVNSLAISGLSADKVLFLGFLPRKNGKQSKIWEDIKKSEFSKTIIFYESHFRIKKTLENLKETFGNVDVIVTRELTKKFEEVVKKDIDSWITILNKPLKGEIVVLFRYNPEEE